MRFLAILATLLLCQSPAFAQAHDAKSYVDNVASQVLAIAKNSAMPIGEKQPKLETIFADVVDVPTVAKFVLGRHWRTATPAQQAAYVKAYGPFLIKNYAGRIAKYSGQTYKIVSSKKDADDTELVGMQILDPNGPPISMVYRLKPQNGKYLVSDIVIENVSLVATQRSEFNAVVTKHGLDFLISALEKRAAAAVASR